MLKIRTSSGFTLIEILVASVILFSSMAVISLIYKGAYLSAEKANTHVTISGVVPAILNNIQQHIRSKGNASDTVLKGGSKIWGVSYQWTAGQTAIKSAPAAYDPDSGKDVTPPSKYKLWLVNLNVSYGGTSKSYQFNEFSWNEK